jgi:hypothetical protein
VPQHPHPDALAAVRSALAAAAAGAQFVSESEAPFTPVALPPPAAPAGGVPPAAPTAAEIRGRFDLGPAAPVAERTLDAFFRFGIEDVDPADAAAGAAAPGVRALREAVRRLAPDARAFRVGDGPRVRYLVVGHAADVPGALVGVETVGYES